MNARVLSTLVAAVFVLLGAIFLGFRHHVRQEVQEAAQVSYWKLTYDVTFSADNSDAEMHIALPFSTRHCQVVKEEPSPDPDLRSKWPVTRLPTQTRELQTFTRRADDFRVGATFILRLSPRAASGHPQLESLSADARQRFLREEETIPTSSNIVQEILQNAPDESETHAQRLQWLFDFCTHDIQTATTDAPDDVEVALASSPRRGTPLAKARALTALCRRIKIPARLVTGFVIEQQQDLQPRVWVEVFMNQSWVPFDPVSGYARYLPMNYVPVRRGGESILRPIGVSDIRPTYSVAPMDPPPSVLQSELQHPVQILDLTRLPLPMHEVMKVLLLLPLAAFITAVIRNVVGIGTFGTFSPALLAMSFIYADWETGLAILIVVLTTGLVGRSLLERLHLLMVPRLAIILTVVILCVVFGVSLLDYSGLTLSSQAVLLPMVILTMLIERFHVATEEDGPAFSLQMAVGTIIVAVLCFLTLSWGDVGQFILIYPETHFFTIAALIVLGRYAGYRITELWRFHELIDSGKNK